MAVGTGETGRSPGLDFTVTLTSVGAYTLLIAKQDPGQGIVWLAFAALITGTPHHVLPAAAARLGAGRRRTASCAIVGRSDRYVDFEREFGRLLDDLVARRGSPARRLRPPLRRAAPVVVRGASLQGLTACAAVATFGEPWAAILPAALPRARPTRRSSTARSAGSASSRRACPPSTRWSRATSRSSRGPRWPWSRPARSEIGDAGRALLAARLRRRPRSSRATDRRRRRLRRSGEWPSPAGLAALRLGRGGPEPAGTQRHRVPREPARRAGAPGRGCSRPRWRRSPLRERRRWRR